MPRATTTIAIKANQHVRVFIDSRKEVSIVMRWKDFDAICEFFRRTMFAVEMVADSVPLTRTSVLERVLKRKLTEMLSQPSVAKDIPRAAIRRR